MHFTDAEVGLYIRLLCVQWSTGKIPCDNHELSSYGKGDTKVDRVKAKFEEGKDGFLRNKRLELEREKQKKYRKSRSDNGKNGGRPPKPHGKHVVLKPKAQESSPSPSPVSSTKEEGEASPPPVSQLIKKIFDKWNTLANLPKCLIVSDHRRRKLEVRLKDPFFNQHWETAMAKVATSDFCKGVSDRGWRASFDWFIQPDVCAKVMEGKYDNRTTSAPNKPNPRNFGIAIGPTNYATAKPRLQRETEEKRRLAEQVAAHETPPPAVGVCST